MSTRLKLYLIGVGAVALALLSFSPPPELNELWVHYAAWTLVCFVSESLWLVTPSGGAYSSMASTANIAALILWGRDASMWIVSISTLLANMLLQKKPWERAVFNASQSTIMMWVAGLVAVALGAPLHGVHGLSAADGETRALLLIPAFLGMVVAYMAVNRVLVSVAVAWSSDRGYWRVLREDWLFRERLYSDTALFLLSGLVVICFEAIRYVGLLLFYAPLRIIYASSVRYGGLRSAQKMLIHSERMAAKGEMAAEIGHELRNQLVAINGRAQLLIRDAEREQYANVGRHSQIILEQARRVEAMSKGLMDFSRAELKVE